MTDGTYLSWEEVQRLALPPNTAMLIPPPEPMDVAVLAAGPPPARPSWLDDSFYADAGARPFSEEEEKANRSAAEREEFGPGGVRLLTNLIAVNALMEYAKSPPKNDDEEQPELPQRKPDDPTE